MKKYLKSFVSLKPSHVCNIFDRLIYPILSYGCEAWGFTPGMYLERLHLKLCKQNCEHYFVYGELERYPLVINKQYIIIKFWLNTLKYAII